MYDQYEKNKLYLLCVTREDRIKKKGYPAIKDVPDPREDSYLEHQKALAKIAEEYPYIDLDSVCWYSKQMDEYMITFYYVNSME
jgi:hypothetical protein